jgi:hypothetical protein
LEFIATREGAMLTGYVPRDAGGNPCQQADVIA